MWCQSSSVNVSQWSLKRKPIPVHNEEKNTVVIDLIRPPTSFSFFGQVTKVIVYIEETDSMADVTFPSLPHVVSLLHYDNVARSPDNLHPPAGYPAVCVTVSLK